MQYTTVFEAGRQGFPWLILFPGLALSFVALWGGRLFSARPVPPSKQDQAVFFSRFAYIFAAISLVITIALTMMVWRQYKSAREILRRGDFETVEGIVQHFHAMPAEGHDTERFSLGGVEFKYSSGWGAVFFNSDLNHGYIHDGVCARIGYKNEEILKVEVNSADIPRQNKSPFHER